MSALQLVVDLSDDGERMVVGCVTATMEGAQAAGSWLAKAMIERDAEGREWRVESVTARVADERVAWRCEMRRAGE